MFRWATALVVLVACGRSESKPPPPPGADLDPQVRRIFREALPDYLIALDGYAEARRLGNAVRASQAEEALGKARTEVVRPEGLAALGEAAAKRLEEVVGRAREVVDAPAMDVDSAGDGLLASVAALDDALAAARIPVFLDGDVLDDGRGRRIVIAYAFSITQASQYHAGETAVRALRLRRLDTLNYEHALLGFTRPGLREALVLLDQLDGTLANQVLPVMADGARFRIVESAGGGDFAERDVVEAKAGEAVRADLAKLADPATTAKVGRALGRRAAIFEGFRKKLTARGIVLSDPSGVRLDKKVLDDLAGLVAGPELDELRFLDAELGEPKAAEVARAIATPLIDAVERHEVQHRLDGLAGGRGDRAREELSAYLAELSRGPGETTRLELTLLAHFVFDREGWGTAECDAALAIFEGLVPDEGALVVDHEVDRAKAARIFLALLARPETDVRKDAGALWERLFGSPLPLIRRD